MKIPQMHVCHTPTNAHSSCKANCRSIRKEMKTDRGPKVIDCTFRFQFCPQSTNYSGTTELLAKLFSDIAKGDQERSPGWKENSIVTFSKETFKQ